MHKPLQRTAVLNVVGLTPSLLPHAPRLSAYAEATGGVTALRPVFPAVTCSVQSSMLTGLSPGSTETSGGHGVVGNGWYDRESAEVRFWQRSDRIVHGEKVWDAARRRAQANDRAADNPFTCANLFWWHNTYSTCDIVLQARPIYKADGRKTPDCYSHPPELRDQLQAPVDRHTSGGGGLGRFPLFNFWGPRANLNSTRWIADAACRIDQQHRPTLGLVYLPHLDYGLQKLGPNHADIPQHVADLDAVVGQLLDHYAQHGVKVLIVSEYGIEPTLKNNAAIFINRHLRDAGLLTVRTEDGRELLDPGACQAFAVADHQVAHVYHDPKVQLPDIRGCTRVVLDYPRAGNTLLVADPGRWFTYDYWPADRDELAPDFARTVDIHRKPGYDPRELLIDPQLKLPAAAVAWKLLRKKLGFRQLMDVVPLDTDLVRGTHGRTDMPPDLQPLLIGCGSHDTPRPCTEVRDAILQSIFDIKM